MDVILSSFEIFLRWDVWVAILIGSVGGVIIGAIPGVGPAVAIAILLPATYSMDPIIGITVLLGIYGSAMYGGAIPAILINTPGTPVNALTTYDGYSMTKNNKARRAITLAYWSSFTGGIISIIALIFMTSLIAKVAPLFGSRDILMAALLGLVLVVISHRKQTVIAGMLVFFGMFISTVGMESVKYTKRFTFDQSWLLSGFDLITVLLGLFAVSQALILLTGNDKKVPMPSLKGGKHEGFFGFIKYKTVAIISSFMGVIMGIIPGVGEFLAQFFSYNIARGISKKPERFGKGAPEGIIAAEAANNAVPAAAMIPLLALGIPGEALTAMMLSVFYVHSIIPGPDLFANHLDFVYGLYESLFIINIIVMIFLLVATKSLLRIIQIPQRFLGITILGLSFVGVYTLRNSFVDCIMCAFFGIFGYVLKKLDLPIVPIILGMVLGTIMEQKFRASQARIDNLFDYIDRPISGTIFAIIVIALSTHFWVVWRQYKKTN
ncbi:MAG: tripartite tricarboxylate transporter permease [Pseudomonadota bacterium]|nr:tripartite tricarboxylate transporter permease [Pseudomonadota bacterium]